MFQLPKSKTYQVEEIIDEKILGGELFYCVKWKGYPYDKSTWEPEDNLRNVPEELELWKEKKRKLLRLKEPPSKHTSNQEEFHYEPIDRKLKEMNPKSIQTHLKPKRKEKTVEQKVRKQTMFLEPKKLQNHQTKRDHAATHVNKYLRRDDSSTAELSSLSRSSIHSQSNSISAERDDKSLNRLYREIKYLNRQGKKEKERSLKKKKYRHSKSPDVNNSSFIHRLQSRKQRHGNQDSKLSKKMHRKKIDGHQSNKLLKTQKSKNQYRPIQSYKHIKINKVTPNYSLLQDKQLIPMQNVLNEKNIQQINMCKDSITEEPHSFLGQPMPPTSQRETVSSDQMVPIRQQGISKLFKNRKNKIFQNNPKTMIEPQISKNSNPHRSEIEAEQEPQGLVIQISSQQAADSSEVNQISENQVIISLNPSKKFKVSQEISKTLKNKNIQKIINERNISQIDSDQSQASSPTQQTINSDPRLTKKYTKQIQKKIDQIQQFFSSHPTKWWEKQVSQIMIESKEVALSEQYQNEADEWNFPFEYQISNDRNKFTTFQQYYHFITDAFGQQNTTICEEDQEFIDDIKNQVKALFVEKYKIQLNSDINSEIQKLVNSIVYENMELQQALNKIDQWMKEKNQQNTHKNSNIDAQRNSQSEQLIFQKQKSQIIDQILNSQKQNQIQTSQIQTLKSEKNFQEKTKQPQVSSRNIFKQNLKNSLELQNPFRREVIGSPIISNMSSQKKPSQYIRKQEVEQIMERFSYRGEICFRVLLRNGNIVNTRHKNIVQICGDLLYEFYQNKLQDFGRRYS